MTRAGVEKEVAILEASKRDALALVVMAKATQRMITKVAEAIIDQDLPAICLLGEKFINSIQDRDNSPNAKIALIPVDLPSALRGILGVGNK